MFSIKVPYGVNLFPVRCRHPKDSGSLEDETIGIPVGQEVTPARELSTSTPISSWHSRFTASHADSPSSTTPPGRVHSFFPYVWCTSSTRSWSSNMTQPAKSLVLLDMLLHLPRVADRARLSLCCDDCFPHEDPRGFGIIQVPGSISTHTSAQSPLPAPKAPLECEYERVTYGSQYRQTTPTA